MTQATTTRAGTTAESGFRHDALLYAGERQFVERTAAFVRDALECEEPVLVAVIEPRRSLLREELGRDAAQVEFLDMARVGRNPARIIPAWQQWVEQHRGSGRGFRGVGEPIWAARDPQALLECQIHEQLLNTAFDDGPAWWLVCPYDVESLAAPVIERAHHTHPRVHETSCGNAVTRGAATDRPSTSYPHAAFAPAAMFAAPLPEPDPASVLFEAGFGVRDLGRLRRALTGHAVGFGLDPRRAGDLVLAADELATNSIRYGGGTGTLRLWPEGDALVCEVRDAGLIDDPLIGRRRPRGEASGGAGLWLTNQVADLVQIRSTPQVGTTVRVRVGPAEPEVEPESEPEADAEAGPGADAGRSTAAV